MFAQLEYISPRKMLQSLKYFLCQYSFVILLLNDQIIKYVFLINVYPLSHFLSTAHPSSLSFHTEHKERLFSRIALLLESHSTHKIHTKQIKSSVLLYITTNEKKPWFWKLVFAMLHSQKPSVSQTPLWTMNEKWSSVLSDNVVWP